MRRLVAEEQRAVRWAQEPRRGKKLSAGAEGAAREEGAATRYQSELDLGAPTEPGQRLKLGRGRRLLIPARHQLLQLGESRERLRHRQQWLDCGNSSNGHGNCSQ